MKLLHVITGLDNGGAEAVLTRLVAADVGKGVEHHVISLMGRGIYAETIERAGVSVHSLNFPRGGLTAIGIYRLFQLIRRIRPDVVQTWMYHSDLIGGVISRLAGIRAVSWGIRHANLDPAHNSRTTLFVMRLCAWLSSWVPCRIVSCSELATGAHIKLGYSANKFVQIPNGYNLERFHLDVSGRNSVRSELGLTENEFVLGMVARFDAQKDHQNLLKALRFLKNRGMHFSCLLVGVGMDRTNTILLDWIKDAGISGSVKLLGPRGDIPAVMSALDVHVLSSLGEGFPNVLAEAMACGTPCVTTDAGDAAVIVADHGWVVPVQDAEALAQGLTEAHESFEKDAARWQLLRISCRTHITNNFDLEKMCERYREVWRACIRA